MESRHCVWVSGSYGLRDEMQRLDHAGRAPVWSSTQKAFSVSEATARRALAALEHLGWDLVVEGPRTSRSGSDRDVHRAASQDLDRQKSEADLPQISQGLDPDIEVPLW
jgi:hypothetical protein